MANPSTIKVELDTTSLLEQARAVNNNVSAAMARLLPVLDEPGRIRADAGEDLGELLDQLLALEQVFGVPALAEPIRRCQSALHGLDHLHRAHEQKTDEVLKEAAATKATLLADNDSVREIAHAQMDRAKTYRAHLQTAVARTEARSRRAGTRPPSWLKDARDLLGGVR